MKHFSRFLHQWAWVILVIFCILGLIYPAIGIGAVICMLAPIVVAFFNGRKWCGTYCPRGSFNDVVLSKVSFRHKIPALLGDNRFRISFLVLILAGFCIQLVFSWGDISSVGRVFVRMIIITTLAAVILGSVFNHRAWCLICPMGTMAGFTAKKTSLKREHGGIRFNQVSCIDCKLCTRSCPMNIDVHRYKTQGKVLHSDCIQCGTCMEKCPRKSLHLD